MKLKRIIATLLTAVMVMGMLPMQAAAWDGPSTSRQIVCRDVDTKTQLQTANIAISSAVLVSQLAAGISIPNYTFDSAMIGTTTIKRLKVDGSTLKYSTKTSGSSGWQTVANNDEVTFYYRQGAMNLSVGHYTSDDTVLQAAENQSIATTGVAVSTLKKSFTDAETGMMYNLSRVEIGRAHV